MSRKQTRLMLAMAALAAAAVGLTAQAQAATYNWAVTGSGNWSTTGNNNWGTGTGGAFPNAADDVANFGASLTGAATVSLPTGTTTVGKISLSGSNNLIIQSNTLGLSNTAGNAIIDVTGSGTLEIKSIINATGEVMEKTGSGWLKLSSSSTSTFSSILVSGGVLETTGEKAVGNYLNPLTVASGATFQFTGANGKTFAGTMPFTIGGTGSNNLGALRFVASTYGQANLNSQITTTSADATLAFAFPERTGGAFENLHAINAKLTGTGGFVFDMTPTTFSEAGANKDRLGVVIKNAAVANDYTGDTVIKGNAADAANTYLVLDKNSNTAVIPGNLIISNATVAYGTGTTTGRTNLIATSATVTLNGAGTLQMFATGGGNGSSQNIAKLIINDTGAVTFAANDASRLILGSATPTARGLHLTTGGTLIVNNTFDPTYNVNGAAASSGRDFAVVTGATLGGNGTIGNTNFGSVTVAGTLAPGNSVGTLNSNVGVTINGKYAVELSGAIADLLNVTGVLAFGSGSTLDIAYLTAPTLSQYKVATATSITGLGNLSLTGQAGWSAELRNSGTELWVAIPEPASIALLGLAGLLMLPRRSKKA